MNPIQVDITPYTITAISLIIVGLASMIYLLRLKEKSNMAWTMILGLACFSASMVAMALQCIVFWGRTFIPMVDAFSVVSMAAMVEFAFGIPPKANSWGSRVVRFLTYITSTWVLLYCFYYAIQFLVFHNNSASIPDFYPYLNPLTFILALAVSIYRTVSIQNLHPRNLRESIMIFLRPEGRPAHMMRNFSLALSIGLVQGIVSGFGMPGYFPPYSSVILINLSLLLMLVAIVYASFDFTSRQPSLVVRLIGLSLVTLLAVLGGIGLYNADLTMDWVLERNAAIMKNTREALHAGFLDGMPNEVSYVLAWPLYGETKTDSNGYLVTARQANFDPQSIFQEDNGPSAAAAWGYYLEGALDEQAARLGYEYHLHYGSNPIGTVHQYAGMVFDQDGRRYEVGFNLVELNQIIQKENTGIIWGILSSAIIILFIFPLFFRSNLVRPLERLLSGVRQADAGNLEIQVKVTHNDEVGYLTETFNKMVASLQQELAGRQKAEAQLRQLNLTLEERVADRTRELEAMYELSAASNQARDPQTLMNTLLERSLAAIRAPLGFIALYEGQALNLVASQNLPAGWLPFLNQTDWAVSIIEQNEPVLIADSTCDERTPFFMRQGEALALIVGFLQAEGRLLGILGMARPKDKKFDLDEVALSVSVFNQVAIAVHTERLRQLVQQATVVEERQRLARDLHDSVTQSLYGLVTLTEVGLMPVENFQAEDSRKLFSKIGQSARQAIREMRLFIHQLRPPELEKEGLVNALDLRLAAVEGRSDVKARLIADENIHLPLPIETAFYLIAQEALNNILKHASAKNVTISLRKKPKGVIMEVNDDGIGFIRQNSNGGMGLENMQSRATAIGASLEINSRPGAGTRVTVNLEMQA